MPDYIFPEWLAANSVRAFPLSELGSRKDVSGSIQLPDSLLVAAAINAHPDYSAGIFFVSQVSCFQDFVQLQLSFEPTDAAARVVASVTVVTANHAGNTSYVFAGSGEDASVVGSLTIGDLEQAQSELSGVFSFTSASTAFEVSALLISVPALKYLQVYSGSELIGTYGRTLKLREGTNIRLQYVGTDTVRIDAINGDNLLKPAGCDGFVPPGPCIRTINGIGPDSDGNFTLDGSECIDVTPGENSVTITDTCAQGCCGCAELEALVTAQKAVEQQLSELCARKSLPSNLNPPPSSPTWSPTSDNPMHANSPVICAECEAPTPLKRTHLIWRWEGAITAVQRQVRICGNCLHDNHSQDDEWEKEGESWKGENEFNGKTAGDEWKNS